MTALLSILRVPQAPQTRDLDSAIRVVNENFRSIADAMNRAIGAGTLVADGSITLAMLATATKTLVGDVTGTIGSTGATVVEKIRGANVPDPAGGDNGKSLTYDSGTDAFTYIDKLTDVFTTRGDLLYRGASAEDRLAVGGANTLLKSDGTDPGWSTLSALIDAAIGSTRGGLLHRGAAGWEVLSPGTSGHFLKSNGAGADLSYAAGGGGSTSPLTTKGDIWAYSTADDRFPVGGAADGEVLTRDAASTFGFKWSAAASGTNALLDGANHTDTVAGTVVRGDIIVGNSTPKWARVAVGGYEAFPMVVAGASGVKDTAFDLGPLRYYPNRGCMVYNAQNAGNAVGDGGGVRTGITVLGTRADGGDTVRYCNKYTSATTPSGSQAGPGGLVTATLPQPRHYLAFRCDFKLVTTTNGVFWAGLTSANLNAADPTAHIAAIRFLDGTDTNFRCCTKDGSTLNNEDSGVAKDTNWHDLRIETPDAGTTYNFYIDGAFVKACTAHVPTTTQAMGMIVAITILSTGTADEIRNSYIRLATGPHLFS